MMRQRSTHNVHDLHANTRPHSWGSVRGFAFVELLVAMALFIVACLATLVAYLGGNLLVENARQTNLAWHHLSSLMEGIHATPFTTLLATFPHQVADGGVARPYVALIGGTGGVYPLPGEQITVCYPDAAGSCAAAPPVATSYEVRSTLTWTQRGRARTLSLSTVKISS
jgi:hypothetical protein